MILISIFSVPIIIILGIYFFQEKLIFFPEKLNSDFKYQFPFDFEEVNFQIAENVKINALHFKASNAKGIVLYAHGNSGSLRTWGEVANNFIKNNYDLLIYDYRGFGKSTGYISESGLYDDATFIYNQLKNSYKEKEIIIYGRSIGTGIATKLASVVNSKHLILESPYYNLKDLVQYIFPIIPSFFLRYRFRIDQKIGLVKCPITIFHGTLDEVIYFGSCLKLKKHLKNEDVVVEIAGGHHNDLFEFDDYRKEILRVMS